MSQISRRAWLEGVALLSAAAMLASTPAEAKVTKAAVHYRDSPKGMQMCHMCKYYIASGGRSAGMCMGMMGTGACQLVQAASARWAGATCVPLRNSTMWQPMQQMMDGVMVWGMGLGS